MTHFCFISPIGFGIIDSSNDEIKWNFFEGNIESIAQTYYNVLATHDYSGIESLIPENENCIIHTNQRSIFAFLSEKYENNDTIIVKLISLEYNFVESLFNRLSDEEKEKSDFISTQVAILNVQNQKETRDVYVAQSIAALDDLTKTINLVSNRLREWYGIHFPELGESITDTEQFFRLITVIGNRNTDWETLNVSEKKEQRIREMAEHSLGTSINVEELKPIIDLAKLGQDLSRTRQEIEEYIENAVFIIMPNVTKLVGPLVSARLLSQAGSLRNLAKMPSSTVQLLGAERALFRHLKTGEKPPKHGFLFQSGYVHQAPYHQRGRIARAIAGKVSIASRLDHFLGEEYPNILDDLNKRLDYISKNYKDPPIRKKKSQSSRPRSHSGDKRKGRGGKSGFKSKKDFKPKKDFKDKKGDFKQKKDYKSKKENKPKRNKERKRR